MYCDIKSIKDHLDVQNLAKIGIVANTADYLFDCFVRNQSVLEFSQNCSDQEIIKLFYEAYTSYQNEKSIENLVIIYSCVIALSLKQSSYVYGFFEKFKKYDIKWAIQLYNIFHNRMKNIEISNINMEMPIISNYNSSNSSIESTTINL